MSALRKNFHWYTLLAVAAITISVWHAVFFFEGRYGKVWLHVFDVGQGDGILIEAANGNKVLVDGGPDGRILAKLGSTLPFWDREIDLVILTHPHADHLDGLVEVLKRYKIGAVLESGVNHSIPEYSQWHEMLEEKGVKVYAARAGERINLSEETYLDILSPFGSFIGQSPKNIHDAVVVTRLSYASTTALLMGDAERVLEHKILVATPDVRADILKIGHHGSKTSTSDELLKAARPTWAIISVGQKNRFGHPTQGVLDRLASFGIKTLRTDQDGDVNFVSDGVRFDLVSSVR